MRYRATREPFAISGCRLKGAAERRSGAGALAGARPLTIAAWRFPIMYHMRHPSHASRVPIPGGMERA